MCNIIIKTDIGNHYVTDLASMLGFVSTFAKIGVAYTIEVTKPVVEYVTQFDCGLTGDKIVILNLDGVETAVSFDCYINNYYDESEHHEKVQAWEDKQMSGVPSWAH